MNRAPFGLPCLSPSGIPLHEQTGAIPSVFIDDDSASCPSGISDSIKINLGPEGDQE